MLLLAVSQLVLQGQARSIARLVHELLKASRKGTRAWAENAVIAGEILTQAERKHFDGVGAGRLWSDTVEALRGAMVPGAEPSLLARITKQASRPLLNVADRVRAGMALSLLGDPRLGIASLEPQWCGVPAGAFLMGSNDLSEEPRYHGKPQRTLDLPGFRIARYPVTNAQWRMFIDAGGYEDRRWWSFAGWATKEQEGWTQPGTWDNPQFNGANQPVVGVSWYEATAFCSWLSVELGYKVRLPSEAEWEKAARGTDGRTYPWGNQWHVTKANTYEGGFGMTTPVGCFPDGVSPCGVLDMGGNVWEWTATPWTDNYQEGDGTLLETEDGNLFVFRGGAWGDHRWFARYASRNRDRPSFRHDDVGMRVCADLILGS